MRLFCFALLRFSDSSPTTDNHSPEHNSSLSAPAVPANVVFLLPFSRILQPFPRFGVCNSNCSPPSGAAALLCGMAAKGRYTLATLASLQGNGGGRIPMDSFSYAVSRQDLTAIISSMPTTTCRAMHIAAQEGDLTTAQHLLREAAEQYFTAAPAAPAATPPASRRRARRDPRRQTPSRE